MNNELKGKYFIKTSENGTYRDLAEIVDGLRILSVSGFLSRGKATNIYTAQWIDSQAEDFMITAKDSNGNPVVIRENVDISVTFIIGKRYASGNIDPMMQYQYFTNMVCGKDVWIKSLFVGREAHCIALENFEPTTINLQRGANSYILATIKFHTLDTPKAV